MKLIKNWFDFLKHWNDSKYCEYQDSKYFLVFPGYMLAIYSGSQISVIKTGFELNFGLESSSFRAWHHSNDGFSSNLKYLNFIDFILPFKGSETRALKRSSVISGVYVKVISNRKEEILWVVGNRATWDTF